MERTCVNCGHCIWRPGKTGLSKPVEFRNRQYSKKPAGGLRASDFQRKLLYGKGETRCQLGLWVDEHGEEKILKYLPNNRNLRLELFRMAERCGEFTPERVFLHRTYHKVRKRKG